MERTRDQGQEDRNVSEYALYEILTISDGTLLTNRFHFAIQDGPLKGKGGLVGWFK